MRNFLLASLFILLAASHLSAQELDLDGDGVSDLPLISPQTDGSLSWQSYSPASGQAVGTAFLFGQLGDQIALAAWQVAGSSQAAVVRGTNSTKLLQWVVRSTSGAESSFQFGTRGSTAVSGADFDGDGFSDAAIVRSPGSSTKKLLWRVLFSPLSAAAKRKPMRTNLGPSTSLPFFMRFDTSGDVLASAENVAAGVSIKTYNPRLRKRRSLVLNGVSLSEAPLPLRQSNGSDALGIIQRVSNTTSVSVFSPSGQLLNSISFAGTGTILAGDFIKGDASPGEEVAIQNATGFQLFNPNSGQSLSVATPTGIPVDHININKVSTASTPGTPTPSTTPSTTPTPGACQNEVRNPRDGTNGFLWKPISDLQSAGRGNLAIHIPSSFAGRVESVDLYNPDGTYIERGTFGGIGNPDRPLFRFSRRGPTYPVGVRVVISVSGGCTTTYVIETPGQRID